LSPADLRSIDGERFWLLAEATLIGGVVLAWFLAFGFHYLSDRVRRRVVYTCGIIALSAAGIGFTRYSFYGIWADGIIEYVALPAILLLLVMVFDMAKSWRLKAPFLALAIILTILSLAIGTLGALGVGLACGDLPITSELPVGPDYVCRQQRFGNALSRDGIRVKILHQPWYLPGIERECYDWIYYDEGAVNAAVTSAQIEDSIPGKTVIHFVTADGKKLVDTLR
jgi:hypothetical protein